MPRFDSNERRIYPMAKKKRKPAAKKPPRHAQPPTDLPSRQALEAMMRQLTAGLQSGPPPDTPLDQAQEVVYQAFEEPNPKRRVELARAALKLSPDCADAYNLLAEHAPTRKQSLTYYEQAVAAGERALGPDAFRDDVGHFWGILETRPYMRARLGLAHSLWTAAKRDEAVAHLRDMLRLNPNDNQGIRYTLAGFLLFLDRDTELAQLLDQYSDEGSAAWDYTKALLAFRQHGDTPDTRKLLQRAIKTNKHVPAYLLGTKFPPAAQPEYFSPGDESEALEYLNGFLAGWKSTLGAIAWVRATLAKPKPAPQSKGPGEAVKKLLQKLPQAEVWQCDFRMLPNWMMVAGEPLRPWATLVTNSNGQVLGHQVSEETPTPGLVWDTLAQVMRKPAVGQAHRPATIQVRAGACWEDLRTHFNEIGVAVETMEKLDEFDMAFASLAQHVNSDGRPALSEAPGMTPDRVRGFYDAAAGFFRQAPWKRVGYEAAIRIECDHSTGGPWFAVLMGQSGLTIGLALYEDLNVLRRMWAGAEDKKNARETVATSVMFNEAWDISPIDLDAATTHGWPVARPDAYPEVIRKERGMSMRLPLPLELELLEGCLRAVPEFVLRRAQDDTTREEITVPTAGGTLKLSLSWVTEA
jgi:tetratricopeptide (TPR) repeat protein